MSEYETLKLGIKKWINEQAYLTAIFSENSNVRPSRLPYATVRFESQNSLGLQDEQKDINDDGIVEVRGHRTLTVGIDVYGDTAISKMEMLKNSLGKLTVLNMLDDEYGIAIIDIGPIQNLSGLLETKYEERAHMDVIIGYATSVEDNVGLIEHVEINEEVIDIVSE